MAGATGPTGAPGAPATNGTIDIVYPSTYFSNFNSNYNHTILRLRKYVFSERSHMADITTVSDGIQMTYTYLNNDFGSSNYSPAALFKSVNTFYIGVLQNDHMHSGHTYQRVTSVNLDIYTSTDNKGHPEFNACYKGVNIMINNHNVGGRY